MFVVALPFLLTERSLAPPMIYACICAARSSSSAVLSTATTASSHGDHDVSVLPETPAANEPSAFAAAAPDRVAVALASLRIDVAKVKLDEATRAFLHARLSDVLAQQRGRSIESDGLLMVAADTLPLVAGHVLAGRVEGFHGASLRYTVELMGELVAARDAREQQRMARAVASTGKALSTRKVLACRAELVRRTADVLAVDAPELVALRDAATLDTRRLDGALTSVEATMKVVEAVLRRGETDERYGRYLAEMGYTHAAVEKLLAPVKPALTARTSHRDAFAAQQLAQEQVDVLEGRLDAQLRQLRERMAAARKQGVRLPKLRAPRRHRAKATAQATPKTPVAPPTPAGGASDPNG